MATACKNRWRGYRTAAALFNAETLQREGLYENYPQIHRLTGELKKIESRIDTLKMLEASGADVDVLMKIEKMEKDLGLEYTLYVVKI